MGIYAVKPRFRKSLRGLEQRAINAGVSADQLTTAGAMFALAAGVAVLLSALSPLWLIAAAPLVLMRLVCNALDGMIACDTGCARPLGQVYNEFADRVGDSAILLAITLRSGSLVLGAATLTLVLLTSYLGTVAAAAGGTRQYVGVMGKADRMVILAAALPVAAFTPGFPVLAGYLATVAVGSALTMLQRWFAIQRELSGASYR